VASLPQADAVEIGRNLTSNCGFDRRFFGVTLPKTQGRGCPELLRRGFRGKVER
jgi:hypothetical protein